MLERDMATFGKVFGSFSDLLAPDIDYTVLQMNATQKKLEADNLELQVQQQADLLREQFSETVGQAKSSATMRGVKVGEGNIAQDIEGSSIAMGKDIQTAKGNAKYKSNQLRRTAQLYEAGAEGSKEVNRYSRIRKATKTLRGL